MITAVNTNQATSTTNTPDPALQDAQNQAAQLQLYAEQLRALCVDQAKGNDDSGIIQHVYQEIQGCLTHLNADSNDPSLNYTDAQWIIQRISAGGWASIPDPKTADPKTFFSAVDQFSGALDILNLRLQNPSRNFDTGVLYSQIYAEQIGHAQTSLAQMLAINTPLSLSYLQPLFQTVGEADNTIQIQSPNERPLTEQISNLLQDVWDSNNNPIIAGVDLKHISSLMQQVDKDLGLPN
jgi:hypothetical protein